ncbi:MAG: plastocyanin [Rickettsiales bacterium]|jgi:plastocyanin
MKKLLTLLTLSLSIFAFSASAKVPEYKIIIKDHKFIPVNLEIPAGQKVRLVIENQDKTVEEFESHDLNREKIIGGGKTAKIFIGPLKSGIYKYFGEFNEDTAQGTITVK